MQNIFNEICLFVSCTSCESKYLPRLPPQSEINNNAALTNLLFSAIPQNAPENFASPFWSISRKNTPYDLALVRIQFHRSIKCAICLIHNHLVCGAREKIRFRVRIEKNSYPKETLSRRFFLFEVFSLTNKKSAQNYFHSGKNAATSKKLMPQYYFPLIYIQVSLKEKSVRVL